MKQLLALLLALALFAVACGGSDGDTESSSTGDADSVQTDSSDDADGDDAMDEDEAMDDDGSDEGLSVDEINVAYFEQWPTPNLLGFNDGSFDEAVGAKINWVPFGGGGAMSEAMEAGDIDISYSQGLTPFANTVNNGADIKLVGIAVTYAEADNCVAQSDLGVTRDNAAEVLDGATVMTPQGNVTNFKMLSMMDFLGVDISSLNILPTDGGATTAAAFADGSIDVGCSFGGSLVAMQEESGGELIMTGAEQASDIGINTYDIVAIPTSFGEDHPDAVVAFLAATEEFNNAWAADPAGTNGAIAAASGMEDVGNFLGGPVWFGFPTLADQLTDDWLGGTVAQNMTEQIQTFVDLGQIDSTIGDFSGSVDPSFAAAAAELVGSSASTPAAPAPAGDDESASGLSVDEINVAYFEQWPTPNLLGFNDGSFDAAVGAKINWVPFGGGGAMSEAMEAGDIDISYSQGLTPFANTVNNGADIKLVGVAVTYAEADNCVAQSDLGVTRDNAAEVLNGATVMTPQGNVTNFKMLSMMDFLGVDISSLTILPTDGGATTAAAFADGAIDVGCSFGGSLVAMQEESDGELIMTGAEQAADIGINTYDIVSIPTSFGEEHGDAVVAFLQATQQFNDAWAADPAGTNGAIAAASGMEDVGNFLGGPVWFGFPSLQDQLTDDWLGGTVAQNMTEQIQTFVDLGQIDSTIGDFSGSIDTSFLEEAAAGVEPVAAPASADRPELDVEEINVAYFEQWPTPNLLGFSDGSFDDAVGAKINWVPFGGGGAMSEAMEAGDIDISYSQGLTPFANTVNNGADIKLVGIAVTYAEADNCVAQSDLGVTRDNAAEVLNGATVMTPQGNVTNFKMLSMMDFLGVDISSLTILPTDGGATTAAAFADGAIDVGCSFGGSLVAMQEESGGELIMTGAEQASDIGINTYDIVAIPTSFGEEHPQAVINFLQATQEFNDAWAADPAGTNGAIAAASGMEDVGNFLGGPVWFGFPSLQDQLTDAWLGGTVAQNMTEQIQTFVDLGQIDSTIGDFSGSIDTSFLEAAAG